MDFYEQILADLIPELTARFPMPEHNETDVDKIQRKVTDYKKSIKAKAFDIARGFLPAGVTTYVSWHTSLQNAKKQLDYLTQHPVAEVSVLATQAMQAMKEVYPESFGHKEHPEQTVYLAHLAGKYAYWDLKYDSFSILKNTLSPHELCQYEELMTKRPEYAELPSFLNECGQIRATFPLDFGSFRDMQRHRPWVNKMPLLHTDFGFLNGIWNSYHKYFVIEPKNIWRNSKQISRK